MVSNWWKTSACSPCNLFALLRGRFKELANPTAVRSAKIKKAPRRLLWSQRSASGRVCIPSLAVGIGPAASHHIGAPFFFGLLCPLLAHLFRIGNKRTVDLDAIPILQQLGTLDRTAVDTELVDRQVDLWVLGHYAGLLDG